MKEFSWDAVFAALVSIGCGIWGGWDQVMTILLVLVTADVVTGFIRAFVQKKLSSDVSFRKLPRKLLIFVIVAMAYQVDNLIGGPITILGLSITLRAATAGYYCLNEATSILENSAAAGLPVPGFLRKALKQLNDEKFGGEALDDSADQAEDADSGSEASE